MHVAVAQSSVNLLTIQLMRVLDLLNKLKEIEAKEEVHSSSSESNTKTSRRLVRQSLIKCDHLDDEQVNNSCLVFKRSSTWRLAPGSK